MKDALYQSKLDDNEKLGAIKRLNKYMA